MGRGDRRRDFNPDQRCLGGAYRIVEDYRNMSRKIFQAKPTVETHFHDVYEDLRRSYSPEKKRHVKQARPSTADPKRRETSIPAYTVNHAERLSKNRALRNAAVGTQVHEHINNVYHMHRRIEDQFSVVERKKNVWDPSIYPAFRQRSTKSGVVKSLCEWLPQKSSRQERTKSAPPGHQRIAVQNPIRTELDAQRYDAFREAIMADIVEHHVYDEPGLRKLFRSWLQANPLEYRPVLLQAIADIKAEMDIA